MKICSRCKADKPLDEFHRRAAAKDGRQPYCRKCNADRIREYRPKNREKFHGYDARYREQNLEQRRAVVRAYYQANSERLRQYARDWRAANPEYGPTYDKGRDYKKRSTYTAARRAREAGLPSERVDRFALFDRDGGKCHICLKPVSRNSFHLDHLIPVAHGGGYTSDNLRVAHPSCNARRGAGRLPAQLLLVG